MWERGAWVRFAIFHWGSPRWAGAPRVRQGGRDRFGGWLLSGFLQFAERTVRALMDAMETRLVTGGKRNGARVVDKAAEGEGHQIAGVGGRFLRFGLRRLAVHLTIHERGFNHTETLHAPAGGYHLGYQIFFDRGAGPISVGIITE